MEAIGTEAEYNGAREAHDSSGKWKEETKDRGYAQMLKDTTNETSATTRKDKACDRARVFDYDIDKVADRACALC